MVRVRERVPQVAFTGDQFPYDQYCHSKFEKFENLKLPLTSLLYQVLWSSELGSSILTSKPTAVVNNAITHRAITIRIFFFIVYLFSILEIFT